MSGLEWIVEAHGCNPAALRDQHRLEQLFEALVGRLNLHPLGKTNWHQFPHTGGITGVSLLSESHIACHTFPEYGSLCLNIFCCRPRAGTDFEALLQQELGAVRVSVRQVDRPYQP
jgi:S-adenosylmethionine decarboxylase